MIVSRSLLLRAVGRKQSSWEENRIISQFIMLADHFCHVLWVKTVVWGKFTRDRQISSPAATPRASSLSAYSIPALSLSRREGLLSSAPNLILNMWTLPGDAQTQVVQQRASTPLLCNELRDVVAWWHHMQPKLTSGKTNGSKPDRVGQGYMSLPVDIYLISDRDSVVYSYITKDSQQ